MLMRVLIDKYIFRKLRLLRNMKATAWCSNKCASYDAMMTDGLRGGGGWTGRANAAKEGGVVY